MWAPFPPLLLLVYSVALGVLALYVLGCAPRTLSAPIHERRGMHAGLVFAVTGALLMAGPMIRPALLLLCFAGCVVMVASVALAYLPRIAIGVLLVLMASEVVVVAAAVPEIREEWRAACVSSYETPCLDRVFSGFKKGASNGLVLVYTASLALIGMALLVQLGALLVSVRELWLARR